MTSRLTRMKFLHWALGLSLFFYLALAEAPRFNWVKDLRNTDRKTEIFPFFTWSLFSSPSRYATRYVIEPIRLSEDSTFSGALEEPVRRETSVGLTDIRFQKMTRDMARAIDRSNETDWNQQRPQVENRLREEGIVRYRLVQEVFDPLIRDAENIVRRRSYPVLDVGDPAMPEAPPRDAN